MRTKLTGSSRELWNGGKMKGGIRQRGPTSWELVYDAPRGVDGLRKQVSVTVTAKNLTAARIERNRLITERDGGAWVEPTKLTTGKYLSSFIQGQAANRVRAKTLEGYERIVRTWLIPHLGHILLARLTSAHIEAMLTTMRAGVRADGRQGPVTGHTLSAAYRVLRNALNAAVKRKLIRDNPCRQVDSPKVPRKEMRALDRAEIDRLLEAVKGHELEPLVVTLLHTGLRRSEACGLQWGDVDLILGTITVSRGLHVLKGGVRAYEHPKSRAGRRLVSLSPTHVLALQSHREHSEAHATSMGAVLRDEMPVFSRPDLTPMLPNTVSHQFSRIAATAGLGEIGMHTLRHTHATVMLQVGVHPKIVQERLGHSSINVTLDTYSHVLPGIQQAAALAFDAGLRATTPPTRGISEPTKAR